MTGDSLPTERKIMILVAVLFIHLILVSTNVVLKNERTLFQNIVGTIISPFQIGFQKTVDFISNQLEHYVFLKNSFQKYRDLKQKYTKLKYENFLLKKKLNNQNYLELIKTKCSNFIKAEVVSIDKNFPLNDILINKGSRDGIVRDMIVLNPQMELVGKIVEPISLFSSKVRLVTSSIGGIGAYIKSKELEGLLTGNNTTTCSFEYLIEKAPVKIGETIVTSGTDRIFPPGILIGQVVAVEKDELTQITKKIDVKPFFIKSSIKHLVIITNDEQVVLNSEQ
jgi:rod shape-determining protein MreC